MRVMGWQPIETAPKGEGILLADGHSIIGIGNWVDGEWWFWDGNADVTFFRDDWSEILCAELNGWIKNCGPTHWMPLPDPPK